MAPRARAHRDRLGSALRTDLEDIFRNLVERLVTRNALPLTGAARADAPLRVREAVGVIDELRGRGADRAEIAVIQRTFGVAFDLREHAVLDVHERAATAVAAVADALQNLYVFRYFNCAHSRFPQT